MSFVHQGLVKISISTMFAILGAEKIAQLKSNSFYIGANLFFLFDPKNDNFAPAKCTIARI